MAVLSEDFHNGVDFEAVLIILYFYDYGANHSEAELIKKYRKNAEDISKFAHKNEQ